MTDTLISLVALFGLLLLAIALVQGGLLLQKRWMWERTRRQQEREYIAWRKAQHRKMAQEAVAYAGPSSIRHRQSGERDGTATLGGRTDETVN